MLSVTPRVQVLDMQNILRLLNSAAYWEATDLMTSIRYERFSDNSLWNTFTRVVTSEPGFAETHADANLIQAYQNMLAIKLVIQLFGKIAAGPSAVQNFLNGIEGRKRLHYAQLQQKFNSVNKENEEIVNSLTRAIQIAATIKLASTIIIAVTPVGATALGAEATIVASAGTVSLVYGFSKDIAIGLASGDANALAISTRNNTAQYAIEKSVESVGTRATGQLSQLNALSVIADQKIANLTSDLARKVSSAKRAKIVRQITKAEAATNTTIKSARNAIMVEKAANFAPVVFAAIDVISAISEYADDMGWR